MNKVSLVHGMKPNRELLQQTDGCITTCMLVMIKLLTLQYGVEDTPRCCLPSPTDQTCYHQDKMNHHIVV